MNRRLNLDQSHIALAAALLALVFLAAIVLGLGRPAWAKEAPLIVSYDPTRELITLVTIDEIFGGLKTAQSAHFYDGGIFDSYRP
jgi:ABC-type sulfate transport system substrate-binding protein